jgi:SNF2 family DNA or RNA helicase
LDQGERLGKTLTGYRQKYFNEGKKNGHVVYSYDLKKGTKDDKDVLGEGIYEREIYQKIGDICISMKAKDYLDLPKRVDQLVEIHLPPKIKQQYDDFEREEILKLADVEEITAVNAAALTNKLLQFANGAIYDEDKAFHEVHQSKMEALIEDIEAANGQPVLVFYSYKSDLIRMQKYLKAFKPQILSDSSTIRDWNAKKISVLLAHPASAGHGLNLQAGGNLLEWYGLPWSLELYQQAVARLDRQGQTKPVINRRLIVSGTMDEDVLAAIDVKANRQDALMRAVKARIEKYTITH